MGDTNPSSDASKEAIQASEQLLTDLNINERLAAFEPLIHVAVDSSDEKEVMRLLEEGRAMVIDEGAKREKGLEDAKNAFSEAVTRGDQEEIAQTTEEVKNWERSLKGFDDFITQTDQYFDELVVNRRLLSEQTPVSLEEQAAKLTKTKEKFDAEYNRIMASIEAQKKSAAIEEIKKKVEKKVELL